MVNGKLSFESQQAFEGYNNNIGELSYLENGVLKTSSTNDESLMSRAKSIYDVGPNPSTTREPQFQNYSPTIQNWPCGDGGSGKSVCETLDPGSFKSKTSVLLFPEASPQTPIMILTKTEDINNMKVAEIRTISIEVPTLNNGTDRVTHEVDYEKIALGSNEDNNALVDEISIL